MTLVDSSVWIDFLRGETRALKLGAMLAHDEVMIHEAVIGELALGNLGSARRRRQIIDDLEHLDRAPVVTHEELMTFIDAHELQASGLGYVDAHLLASSLLAGVALWTRDKRLVGKANELGVNSA